MDLALTHYMTGDVPACLKVLEQVVSAKVSARWAGSIKLAQELLEELKVDDFALARRSKIGKRSTSGGSTWNLARGGRQSSGRFSRRHSILPDRIEMCRPASLYWAPAAASP